VLELRDFPEFFSAIYDKPPFPWQVRLANRVATERKWPRNIALQTATGKTALIDIAVFLLAMQAGLVDRCAAIRTFFVVDRRLVVDQATEHAEKLVCKLEQASDGILREVADRLRRFGGRTPLALARLRGGVVYDRAWCDDPRQPMIVSSTDDQIGSRLLFRGYGCSNSRRPIDAGLVSNDSLLIVDEAHLAAPLLNRSKQLTRTEPICNGSKCPPPPALILPLSSLAQMT
jgi:CRISPR-associated endonuclease/helicase Cas3